jgi:uncharacterized RDD family membrane protein YckC
MEAEPAPHRSYAGLVSRLAALLIDVAVLSLAAAAVRLLPPMAWEQVVSRPAPGWLKDTCAVLATLLPWAYFTFSWWLAGQTLGAIVIGIDVRRTDGGPLALPHSAVRALVGLLLAPLWIVGLILVLWDPRRRALHDVVLRSTARYAPKARARARR